MNPATATQAAVPPQTTSLLDQITDEQTQRESARFDLIQRKATIAAASRCYPDAVTMEAAAIKMMMAEVLQIDPMVALTDIRVYDGKPEISSGLTAAMLQRAGYTWRFVRHDETECRAAFWHQGEPLQDREGKQVEFAFTMAEAVKAGYAQRGHDKEKQNNYDKVPKNMLFARMITNFTKFYAPWVTRGMSIYAPGEIETVSGEQVLTQEQVSAAAASATQSKAEDLKAKLASKKAEAAQ